MKQLLITIAALVLVGCGESIPDISIWEAAKRGDTVTAKKLLEAGADPNLKGELNTSALLIAISRGNQKTAELLIENGANVNSMHPAGSPLQAAADNNLTNIVKHKRN